MAEKRFPQHSVKKENQPNDRLTVAQAARYAHCSVSKIKRLIHAGTLPAVRNGRPYFIERTDLDNLFKPVLVSDEERTAALAREIAANAPALSPASRARLADLLR